MPSFFGLNFIQNQVSYFMRVRCIIIALMWCFVMPTFGQDSTLKIENLKSELKNEVSLEDQLKYS